MATTSWPTLRPAASPSSAGWGARPSARRTARSESGSAPTRPTGSSEPSVKEARRRAPAGATTGAGARGVGGDDVGGGEEEAVRGDARGGAPAERAAAPGHAEVGHGGPEPLR